MVICIKKVAMDHNWHSQFRTSVPASDLSSIGTHSRWLNSACFLMKSSSCDYLLSHALAAMRSHKKWIGSKQPTKNKRKCFTLCLSLAREPRTFQSWIFCLAIWAIMTLLFLIFVSYLYSFLTIIKEWGTIKLIIFLHQTW